MSDKQKGHILAVDDQENWLRLITAILEEEGYQISTASSYNEAAALLKSFSFDVAILDMRLIDSQSYNVQGIALLKELKRDSPATSAIILTGYPDSEQEDKALNIYNADAYIEKVPKEGAFDLDSFIQLLDGLVKRKISQSIS